MANAIAFLLIVGIFSLIIAVAFTLSLRKSRRRAMDEAIERSRQDSAWNKRIADKVEQIKNQKPHPSSPEYRESIAGSRRTSYNEPGTSAPSYDPMTDLMSPLNPLSPIHHVYDSTPDPTPVHHDPSPSYSAPDPSPSYDSGSSYGGDSYGGSSYDSGGGGFDGGSSGGGDF